MSPQSEPAATSTLEHAPLPRDLHWSIDQPAPGQAVEGSFLPILGWAWHPGGIARIEARTDNAVVPAVTGLRREDVARAAAGHPRALCSGFYIEIERALWNGRCDLWVEMVDGTAAKLTGIRAALHTEAFDAAQERVLAVLVCPSCRRRIGRGDAACGACGRPVVWLGDVPSFVGDSPGSLARGQAVSRHPAIELIAKHHLDLDSGGLFLDAGAGWPPEGHPALVQLEMERFPTTNVVADGAELPFPDASFDGVMSHAVMEHVRDPFAYSREIMRVLRPGGRFVVHSAFLQPVHAFPAHYFNTTLEGLKLLFKGGRMLEEGVAHFQQPWLALEWMLRSYHAGLVSNEDRVEFEQMRIGDLLGDMGANRPLSRFQALRAASVLELAAGVYVVGER